MNEGATGTSDIRLEKITPLIRQYQAVKRGVGDAILFFRLGDFYEMFNEDAVAASKLLGILLTKKSAGSGNSVPLAGVPFHSADGYIARLVKAGRKVAICEQVDDGKSRGIMDRAVIRIITPGTLVEETLLAPNVGNFLGAAVLVDGLVGLACVDISTGEFEMGQWSANSDAFINTFNRLPVGELLTFDDATAVPPAVRSDAAPAVTRRPVMGIDTAREMMGRKFGAGSLEAAGCFRESAALIAAGLALSYLEDTRSADLPLRFPRRLSSDAVMELDAATIRNLELLSSITGDGRASLWSVIDRAKTAMGSRLLRRWLLAPLRTASDIFARQRLVTAFVETPDLLDAVRDALSEVGDLERLLARLARPATARVADLVTLRRSLDALPAVLAALAPIPDFADVSESFPSLNSLRDTLHKRLADSPSAVIGEGNVIRPGVHPELDELRELLENQRLHLLKFQDAERARTAVSSLKVSYNKIYGYYIELSKANADAAPADYIRKQTLVNAERYITPELKRFEEKLLAASDRIASIERALFTDLLADVVRDTAPLQSAAERLSRVDALSALAETARRENYARPEIVDADVHEIVDGRHPVVERFCADGFVPNDTRLNSERRLAIVTGPNMAGKSTFIRQTAIITLLAQIGSYVPAKSMRWRPVDRIFTRIGASDDLSRGQSTFFVEMSETAAILRQATRDSLILLDEIGRGTSTYDGLSIAWAVAEHIASSIGAKTLFATHYHELADLAGRTGVHTLKVVVREFEGKIVFMRKVLDGSTDRSFGIAVADLAGIPRSVLDRARTILFDLESGRHEVARAPAGQSDLFSSHTEDDLEDLKCKIRAISINSMTPIQAMAALERLQKELS